MADDQQQTFYSEVDKARHTSGCLPVLVVAVILLLLVFIAVYILSRLR
jgi:hypothetical protein